MTRTDKPLSGKVAVVTGASRGIGREVAVRLAQLGCDVVVAARTVDPRPDLPGTIGETAARVRAEGQKCLAVAVDVTNDDDIFNLAEAARTEFGRVDILINNAAAQDARMYDSIWNMTPDSWRYQYAVNLTASWVGVKAFATLMRESGNGGLIINMTSALPGMARNPNLPGKASTGAAYPSSKVALSRMTEDLAKELSPYGITIVALHPGFVKTDNAELLAGVSGFDISSASGDAEAPLATIEHLATADPSQHAGNLIFAPTFAKEIV